MKARVVLVSLLVSCASFSHAQQLTQQDIENAFYNALIAFCEDGSGVPGFLGTMPFDPYTFETLNTLLTFGGDTPVGTSSYLTLANLVGADPRLWNFLSSLSASNQVYLVQLLNAVQSVTNNADLRAIRDYLSGMNESLVSDISGSVYSAADYLGSIDYEVGAIRSFLEHSGLDGGFESTSNLLDSVLGILRNEENPIEVDIRTGGVAFDILEQILHAIQDGSSSGAGVVDGVTNMVNQGVNVPVDVKNFDSSGSSLDVVLSAFASELSERDWSTLVQNFDGDGSDWLTAFESSVLMRSISNSLAALSPSQRFLSTAEVVTASAVETVATDNVQYSQDLVAASNTAVNFKLDFRNEHAVPDNPWQPAPIYNAMQSAGRFFAKPDPATSSDVIIMGSNNPNRRRAGPRLVPLPEIRFDLEEALLATNEYYNMRNIFNLLWRVLGGAAQLMLLGSFVHWYATRVKG